MSLCNFCESSTEFTLSLGRRPVVNKLQLAPGMVSPVWDIQVHTCSECGLLQVKHEIPETEFYSDYATPSSWKAEPHMPLLLEKIAYSMRVDELLLDVGSNDGKFLSFLRDNGFQNLLGLEPTNNAYELSCKAGLHVIHGFLNSDNANLILSKYGHPKVITLRQTLEHISDLKGFVSILVSMMDNESLLFIEVPDSEVNITQFDYGIWEEHVNYFTKYTLISILDECGLECTDWYQSIFSGLCQTATFRKKRDKSNNVSQKESSVAAKLSDLSKITSWANGYVTYSNRYRRYLEDAKAHGIEIVLLGVGSRSIATCYALGLIDLISLAIDENPAKQSRYIPNTELLIQGRKALSRDKKYIVLLGVNSENEEKVLESYSNFLFEPNYVSILPPSNLTLVKQPYVL